MLLQFKSSADAFARKLASVSAEIYTSSFSFAGSVSHLFSPSEVEWLLDSFNGLGLQEQDRVAVQAFFEAVSKYIAETPVCGCTFAVQPSASFYNAFFASLREYTGNDRLLMDVHIDPTLVGGAIFVYKGRRFDFSLRKDFLHFIAERKI
jgi:hypothetical protein